MRTRMHPGIFNRYMDITYEDYITDSIDYAGSGLTMAMATAWLWRVKTWKWEGELEWTNEGGGGGTFSGATMPATGSYQFTSDSTEAGLRHRKTFSSEASATLDDTDSSSLSIYLSMFVWTIRFTNRRPVPPYISQPFYPQIQISVVGPFGSFTANWASVMTAGDMFQHGSGQNHSERFLRYFFPPPTFHIQGYVKCTPHEYFEYRDDNGLHPIYNSSTGERLLDPHGLV